MPLTQQWLQDPLQCFQQGLSQGLGIEKNASHSHHHFQEWLITTFYIINIKVNTPKCALVETLWFLNPPLQTCAT
jgi:hypothetical protein